MKCMVSKKEEGSDWTKINRQTMSDLYRKLFVDVSAYLIEHFSFFYVLYCYYVILYCSFVSHFG